MWKDNKYWLPIVLAEFQKPPNEKKKLDALFLFDETGNIAEYTVNYL